MGLDFHQWYTAEETMAKIISAILRKAYLGIINFQVLQSLISCLKSCTQEANVLIYVCILKFYIYSRI